jgi:hypothetical protein
VPPELITFGGNALLVAALVSYGARFLVIGGSAARFHFPNWQSDDLDLLIEPSAENARKVVAALEELGIQRTWPVERLAQPWAQIILKGNVPQSAFNADIVTPRGSFDFEAHLANAVDGRVGVAPVKVAAAETVVLLMDESSEPRHKERRKTLQLLIGGWP